MQLLDMGLSSTLTQGDTDHNLVNAKIGVKGFKDIKPEIFIKNFGD